MSDEVNRLVDKSVEAFILSLEVYNKPTIKYRVEGFSFFIVNAWELMLKAELINKGIDIYYRDTDRTLSLSDVVKKVYPDKNTRVRLNLEHQVMNHWIMSKSDLSILMRLQRNLYNKQMR